MEELSEKDIFKLFDVIDSKIDWLRANGNPSTLRQEIKVLERIRNKLQMKKTRVYGVIHNV